MFWKWVKRCGQIVVEGHRKGRDEIVRGNLSVLNIQCDLAQDREK